jgi:5-formyltetrahydrofolate cyclo-ligase
MHAAGHVPALLGLAFDGQACPRFAVDEHDIPLDGVLLPSGLHVFDHGHQALTPFLR